MKSIFLTLMLALTLAFSFSVTASTFGYDTVDTPSMTFILPVPPALDADIASGTPITKTSTDYTSGDWEPAYAMAPIPGYDYTSSGGGGKKDDDKKKKLVPDTLGGVWLYHLHRISG